MTPIGRLLPAVTLAALVVSLVPGVCAADCAALMDCCRKAPVPQTSLASASCCKAARPQMSVPSTMVAEIGSKIARSASGIAPFTHLDTAATGVGFDHPATDQPPPHRAPGVPLYLLNTAVLR